MAIKEILLVGQDAILQNLLAARFKEKKLNLTCVENSQKALALLRDHPFDLVFAEVKMAGFAGLQILEKAKERQPEALIVIVADQGSIENAVEAMQAGAFDYISKPLSLDAIVAVIEKANQHLLKQPKEPVFKEAHSKAARIPF